MQPRHSLSPRAGLAGSRRSWLAGLLLFAGACSRREVSYDYGEPKQRYQIHGELLRLRPENRLAVVKHEKIEGWMEAMTMEFPVPDAAEFAKLKEGSWIRATVCVNDSYFWLTGIVVEK
jgi:protein SCO1/2